MSGFSHRILVVDDEQVIRDTAKAVLAKQGYEVLTAVDGFDGLVQLRRSLPDLIISDLSMPNMSGFEFLAVVRKRFPHIPVIALSGAYNGGLGGVIADAFFFKGQYSPKQLFTKIRSLLESGPVRPYAAMPDRTPLWVPVNEKGYFVVTCTSCLRSSSIEAEDSSDELRELECPHCGSAINILSEKNILKKAARSRHAV